MRLHGQLFLAALLLLLCAPATIYAQCSGSTQQLTATGSVQNLTGPTANSAITTYLAQSYMCSWLISPASGYQTIIIYFQQLDTESSTSCGSSDDYVIVVDGVNKVSGFQKACTSGSITQVITQGVRTLSTAINHQMYIEFVADGDANVGTGFWIKYIALLSSTEAPSTLSTGAIVGIAVGGVALVLIIIVIIVVVILKKQQQRIEELEDDYDSDDSYYDSDDSEYADPESRPQTAAATRGVRPLPPLATGLPARTAAPVVSGKDNYKAPNSLQPLSQEDVEKARKKARRRRRKSLRKRKSEAGRNAVVPAAAAPASGNPRPSFLAEASVATARGVVVMGNGHGKGQPLQVQEVKPPERTLSDLEDEISALDTKENGGPVTVRPAPQDPFFSSNNYAP